jgi:hypothetical protein
MCLFDSICHGTLLDGGSAGDLAPIALLCLSGAQTRCRERKRKRQRGEGERQGEEGRENVQLRVGIQKAYIAWRWFHTQLDTGLFGQEIPCTSGQDGAWLLAPFKRYT